MKFAVLAVVFVVSCQLVSGRIFSRCDLAKKLLRQNFPRDKLEDWVCLVEAESSRNTAAVGPPNVDGSRDYGLFQINDRYWCRQGGPGGDCKVSCNSLLSDDISEASKCAQLIMRKQGWTAWAGWTSKCQGALPDLSDCGLDGERTPRSFYASPLYHNLMFMATMFPLKF